MNYSIAFLLVAAIILPSLPADELPERIDHEYAGEMRLIPAGTFLMGDANSRHANERPQHERTIENPFFIGAYEVTFEQFRTFLSSSEYVVESKKSNVRAQGFDSQIRDLSRPNPSPYSWRNTGFRQGDQFPVVNNAQ